MSCFTVKWLVWINLILKLGFVLSMSWVSFKKKHIRQTFSQSVLIIFWREPLCWSPIFCETYLILCIMGCVMRDVWCPSLAFCKILTLWIKGRPKIPPYEFFRRFGDIPKLIQGGSHMYTMKTSPICNSLIFIAATFKSYNQGSLQKSIL